MSSPAFRRTPAGRAGRSWRSWRWPARALAGAVLVLLVVLNIQCAAPLAILPLQGTDRPLVVDGDLGLARRYAPFVYHAVDAERGRQDLPTRVDFDGNLRGDDNWEHLPHYELPPTLEYAVLSTATHHFLTFHVFHPRDWAPIDLGLHMTHENDGENLQVVVDRASGQVVLLFTQAHYRGGVYAPPGSAWAAGREPIRGLVLRPAQPGEAVREPALDALDAPREGGATVVPYQLESITAKLWPGLRDGSLVGEGGLFDGALRYRGPLIDIGVPRYHEADRFSGPLGPDRGIAPFAVDFRFGEGEVGALFFDPARRYAECLAVPQPWSLEYDAYPFTAP